MKKTRIEYDPNATSEQLDNLKTSKDKQVRWAVASHPNTSPETLLFLSYDKDYNVVENIARNPNSPKEALEVVYYSTDVVTRIYLVSHPNTPVSLHHKLMIDDDATVRNEYYKENGTVSIVDLANGIIDGWFNESWPTHKNASPKSLERLAKHPQPLFRLALAVSDKTPKYLVQWFLYDDIYAVVEAAMRNRKVPTLWIRMQAGQRENSALSAAAKNELAWRKFFNVKRKKNANQ